MRIRTYGVVRGVMLKHPPTRFNHAVLRHLPGGRLPVRAKASAGSAARETCFREARYIGKCVTAAYSFIPYNRHYARAWPQAAGTH